MVGGWLSWMSLTLRYLVRWFVSRVYSKLGDSKTLRWRILGNLQDAYLASWGRLMTKVADGKLQKFAGSERIGVCWFPWKEDPGWCRTRSPGCLPSFPSQNKSWSSSSARNAHWDRLIQLCGITFAGLSAKMISASSSRRQQHSVSLHGPWRTAVNRPDAGCISTQGIRGIIPQCSADVQMIVGCNLHDLFVLACDYSPSQCQMMPNVF